MKLWKDWLKILKLEKILCKKDFLCVILTKIVVLKKYVSFSLYLYLK